ncbi:MAG: VOC family protein [Clostridiales bacterium]|nr:VOC family protein [Clostridiales bacterium]
MIGTYLHVGLTVNDLERSKSFYEKYFGFTPVLEKTFPPEFIEGHKALYREPAGVFSDMAMLQSTDGNTVLELFRFSNAAQGEPAQWHKTGYHHIAIKVDSVDAHYRAMLADGVNFFFPPSPKGNSGSFWTFLADPDGNLIELQD